MTIKAVKPISKVDFIKEAVAKSTKISDTLKTLVGTIWKKRSVLDAFDGCETVQDIEDRANEMERRAKEVTAAMEAQNII